MNDKDWIRNTIRNNMLLRDTEDLLKIWIENKRYEFTDVAFEVISEILLERLGELPEQNSQAYELEPQEEVDEIEEFLIDAYDPEFYDPEEVLWVGRWIRRVAVGAVVLYGLMGLLEYPNMRQIMISYVINQPKLYWEASFIAFLTVLVLSALQAGLIYFVLRALGAILKILMQMELNSREARAPRPEENPT